MNLVSAQRSRLLIASFALSIFSGADCGAVDAKMRRLAPLEPTVTVLKTTTAPTAYLKRMGVQAVVTSNLLLPLHKAPASQLNLDYTAASSQGPDQKDFSLSGLIEAGKLTRSENPAAAGNYFDGSQARPLNAVDVPEISSPAPKKRLWSRIFRRRAARKAAEREEALAEARQLSTPWRTVKQIERLNQAPRKEDETFSFAVIGDAEPGRFWIWRKLFNVPGVFYRMLKKVGKHPVDFSIQLGDMVSRGTPNNFRNFFRELTDINPEKPYLSVIGNHDRRNPHGITDSKTYRSLFGKTNYAFDRGDARFIVIDTSAGRLTPRQLQWLDLVLETGKRKLVFTHMPPAPLRGWMDYPGGRHGWGGFKQGSREFTEILSRHKVDRVYMGHIHGFGVQDYGGVRYVLTGGGGSPLFPSAVKERFHHYLTVTVGPGGIAETINRVDGKTYPFPQLPTL